MALDLDDLGPFEPNSKPSAAPTGAPPAESIVAMHMIAWLDKRRQHQLPAPAPATPMEAAQWWVSCMCEPEQPGETREVATVTGALRWETGFANRCARAFLTWADMPQTQRETVVAGVRDDRVPYRGDSFAFYMAVVNDTYAMRDVGIAAYAGHSRKRLASFVAEIGRS